MPEFINTFFSIALYFTCFFKSRSFAISP